MAVVELYQGLKLERYSPMDKPSSGKIVYGWVGYGWVQFYQGLKLERYSPG